ncbi:hypothetical protein BD324DRAFT_650410 [Kockovaella imperatae]|uniref:Calpain catalytic domain-containing protein n=1 Tax=Kockovaella imperatae TaxID=4999 RepID=A0A1Y1U5C6_9TREE|nr:hypothetical protein BD324DRAFT_654307 [Kockovaella imperatae]XP_021871854.1 hypothetical protein BD324DRAFT_650410 [Kockovaella imperatae]ORX33231.1 hypothetical protein BD324DRAFT_654307 [Kockovaella imperatae]ORX37867.1 hypothetical protein BD324DRAFT_650410 [Kockovaella imperatae]
MGRFHRALWPIDGPTCKDIKQTSVPDCFLAATLCVLADRAPHWLQSAVRKVDPEDADDGSTVDTAEFNIFKYREPEAIERSSTGANQMMIDQTSDHVWTRMNYADDIMGEETDGKATYESTDMIPTWWVPGFQNAAQKMFGDDFLQGGYTLEALAMLTNRITIDISDDIFKKASYTPVTLGTVDDPGKLVGNHAYAVLSAQMDDDDETVTLHNPWGKTDTYKLKDIFNDIAHVTHLKNWDILKPA